MDITDIHKIAKDWFFGSTKGKPAAEVWFSNTVMLAKFGEYLLTKVPHTNKKYMNEKLRLAVLERKGMMKKMMKEIPEIHWEILSYANNHTKEEVIEKYPDYVDYIENIHGFNGR